MAQFPIKESVIVVLAQNLAASLTANAAVFPSPLVDADSRQSLTDDMKVDLRYAKNTVAFDDANKAGEGEPSNTVAVVL